MTKPATTPGRKRSKALQGSMATALLLLAISRVTYAQPPDSARAAPIKPTERQRVVSLVYQLTGAGSYTCSGTSGMKDFEAVRARFEVERTELVSLMTKSPEYAEVKKAVDESHEHVPQHVPERSQRILQIAHRPDTAAARSAIRAEPVEQVHGHPVALGGIDHPEVRHSSMLDETGWPVRDFHACAAGLHRREFRRASRRRWHFIAGIRPSQACDESTFCGTQVFVARKSVE